MVELISKHLLFGILGAKKRLKTANSPRLVLTYIIDFISSHIIFYPSPISLTYAWSFGSLAGMCLVIQMISGLFLSMHYTPHIELAFNSVEYIMRDIPNGWLLRYVHSNGASMFFIAVYFHICKALYYGSYMEPRQTLWCSGVVLLLLMMATAFTGYVLPWGQMSLWGATVITNMVTAIPVAGQPMVHWLWGGESIANPTLNRFYTAHFILPFLIAGMSLVHLALLHKVGSNSPLGSDSGVDDIPFYPYFVTKDVFAFFCFIYVFGIFVFYYPNVLGDPINYIPADPMETPAHVVPEWYFLPYFAILRTIPHKLGGILVMFASIFVLFTVPFLNTSYIRNTTYRPLFKFCFWYFIHNVIMLFWVGQKPIKTAYTRVAEHSATYYFSFFIILVPVVGAIETYLFTYKLPAKTTSKGE